MTAGTATTSPLTASRSLLLTAGRTPLKFASPKDAMTSRLVVDTGNMRSAGVSPALLAEHHGPEKSASVMRPAHALTPTGSTPTATAAGGTTITRAAAATTTPILAQLGMSAAHAAVEIDR